MDLSHKPCATAVLVHGVGSSPAWWNPLLPVLKKAGLKPLPLRLPPLKNGDPTRWRDEVVSHLNNDLVVLIGHSLGAAVCVEAALSAPVAGLVLLACPPFFGDFTPQPPPETGLAGQPPEKTPPNFCARPANIPRV